MSLLSNILRESKCQLHGNACSGFSSQSCLDGRAGSLFTVTYTDCSCERKFRTMLSEFRHGIGRFYDIGVVHDAADSAMAANALVFQYLDDFHANKVVNRANVARAAIDARIAAHDAYAAATPGDSADASDLNVAKLASNSAKAAMLLLFRLMGYVRRAPCV